MGLSFDIKRNQAIVAQALAFGGVESSLPSEGRLDRLALYTDQNKIQEWFATYLSKGFTAEFGEHHDVMLQALQVRGELVVVLVSRGFGKTTTAISYVIYSICYGLDAYVVFFDHDMKTSLRQIKTVVNAFTSNPELMADYQIQRGNVWKPGGGELSFFTSKNPHALHKEVYLRFAGIKEIARGTTYDYARIDAAYINDAVKNRQEAKSAAWNTLIKSIVKQDLMFAGNSVADIGIYFITTIQLEGDISDQFANDPTALVYKQPAIAGDEEDVRDFVNYVSDDIPNLRDYIRDVKGTPPHLKKKQLDSGDMKAYCDARPAYQEFFERLQTTWPGNENFQMWNYVFECYAAGSLAFLRERQHITGDPRFKKFFRKWWVPYFELDRAFLLSCECIMTIDPSAKKEDLKEENDPQAIIVKLFDPDTLNQYYLHVWEGWLTPVSLSYKIFEIMNVTVPIPGCEDMKLRNLQNFCILFESNQAQLFGIDNVELLALYESQLGDDREYKQDSKYHDRGDVRPQKYGQKLYWSVPDIIPIDAKEDKLERIGGSDHRGYAEQRHYHYIPNDSQQDLLVTQYSRFAGVHTHGNGIPLENKIDGPDADVQGTRYFFDGWGGGDSEIESAAPSVFGGGR